MEIIAALAFCFNITKTICYYSELLVAYSYVSCGLPQAVRSQDGSI